MSSISCLTTSIFEDSGNRGRNLHQGTRLCRCRCPNHKERPEGHGHWEELRWGTMWMVSWAEKTPNWQVVMCWNYPRLIRKNAALPKWSAPKAISKPASKRVQKIGESKMFNVRLTSQSRPLARLSLETTPKSNPSLVPWNPVIPKGLWGGNPKSIWIWVVIHSVADFLKKITAATVTRTIYICIYIQYDYIFIYIMIVNNWWSYQWDMKSSTI